MRGRLITGALMARARAAASRPRMLQRRLRAFARFYLVRERARVAMDVHGRSAARPRLLSSGLRTHTPAPRSGRPSHAENSTARATKARARRGSREGGELTVEHNDVARVGVDLLRLEDHARVRGLVRTDEDLDARSLRGGGGELHRGRRVSFDTLINTAPQRTRIRTAATRRDAARMAGGGTA